MKKSKIAAVLVGLSGITYILYVSIYDSVSDTTSVSFADINQTTLDSHTSIPSNLRTSEISANQIQDNSIQKPVNNMQPSQQINADATLNKLELFKIKNEKIVRDEYGNSIVNISTDGFNSKEILISDSQIFYPTEEQLNNGIEGCAMGGYYVELNAKLSMIVEAEENNRVYNYACAHNSQSNNYYLADSVINPAIEKSVETLRKSQNK